MESKRSIQLELASNKSFGIVFSILFFLIYLFGLYKNWGFSNIFLVLFIILLFLSIFAPNVLYFPNKLWGIFGHFLGNFISKIVLSIVFFIFILPFSIFFRIIGKDLINKKIDKTKNSYWEKRVDDMKTMKKQF
tara:strand:+ start:5697 stop:6098 length:402 start_codon:yes stop_codon:yes gene_type:complete